MQNKDPYLQKILEKINKERNLDFSQYRDKLLERRLMVRVRITKRNNFEQYFAYLKFHPDEMDYLMDVMTINVTEFFRDTHVFETIENKVIPELFAKKKMGMKRMNVWSCASASGEEAYSMLMLIAEFLGTKLADYKLNIYGTDIDPQALAKAQEGVYEAAQFKNLTNDKKALVDKYFYDVGNNRYWIREEWPLYMHFKYHDIIADMPLNYMDIILCRNLFIYFNRGLQEKVLEKFWEALNKGGFLILGNVESIIGKVKDKFIEYDRSARIYVKR
ncbi:MAG: protein-glutamate O-methyltransferase CheR [Candidatus Omnitrophota bacterium]|jgi:chemotaxis protein methyltransferase CheR|nr:protein-glutamate O-methyltransferase CheR [Candidatus Omnitrophota bacterium]